MAIHSGRHFLQIPGPTNVPDRVLRAIDQPTIDHRGPEFVELAHGVLAGIKRIFRTKSPVIIYPSSGTGAWEAAIVNTLAPGDTVLMAETGHFATLWKNLANKFKVEVDFVPGDWRHGADIAAIESKLAADRSHKIKAVMVVHNETSTGCVTHPQDVRSLLDRTKHPALLMVDTISGLGSLPYEHDAWGIDVTVCGSQKGLMLPPGLGFNAISDKALAVAKSLHDDALLLGLAGDHRSQQAGLVALYAGDQPLVRPAGGDRDARGGRPRQRLEAPPAPLGGNACRVSPRGASRSGARIRARIRIH